MRFYRLQLFGLKAEFKPQRSCLEVQKATEQNVVAMERIGTQQEVAMAAQFLASDEAFYYWRGAAG